MVSYFLCAASLIMFPWPWSTMSTPREPFCYNIITFFNNWTHRRPIVEHACCIQLQDTLSSRALGLAAAVQPLGRVRARANVSCIQACLARRPLG